MNICIMFLTLLTSQPPMSWLKLMAPSNMCDLHKHKDNVSQQQEGYCQLPPQGKSEDDFDNNHPTQCKNTTQELTMSSTLLTSQPPMSPLKSEVPENMPDMSSTLLTSQPLISPLNFLASRNMPCLHKHNNNASQEQERFRQLSPTQQERRRLLAVTQKCNSP
mmetsp:Transcript_22692/g.52455  ORF Transcript_22692/g.52455 Transcript_22692/m.52455 type:complete len:163 (-) Transcript_22692:116-604(-)